MLATTQEYVAKSNKTDLQSPKTTRPFASQIPIEENLWIEVVDSLDSLAAYRKDWSALCANAVVKNVFYEPWFLLPAIKQLHADKQCRFIFIYQKNKRITDPDILCGFFPLEQTQLRCFPQTCWKLITDNYLYLSLPLLHSELAEEAMHAFLKWTQIARIPIMQFERTQSEGPFQHALTSALNQRNLLPCSVEQSTRAILRRKPDLNDYFTGRGHYRRDMQRRRRRLSDNGNVEFRILQNTGQLRYWQNSYLTLERMSWKGKNGTAIAQDDQATQFFLDVTSNAMELGMLQMLGLFLNNELIAVKCNLCSGEGSYSWKIAFDEQYSKFSPGVLLELENIEYFHNQTQLEWMDSCASEAHPMINRLWQDRIGMQSIYIPTGRFLGEMYCSTRPVLRSIKRYAKRMLNRQS
ncbi:GNAT family N-acetyltransferase [uncultured Rubinisphaera sp.]|uniref:GNAT family N-acetyltransferase n=1 Tax=uncultured Rubinisphaera sp. TaxID=1678686 RepID=UPI0030D854F3